MKKEEWRMKKESWKKKEEKREREKRVGLVIGKSRRTDGTKVKTLSRPGWRRRLCCNSPHCVRSFKSRILISIARQNSSWKGKAFHVSVAERTRGCVYDKIIAKERLQWIYLFSILCWKDRECFIISFF